METANTKVTKLFSRATIFVIMPPGYNAATQHNTLYKIDIPAEKIEYNAYGLAYTKSNETMFYPWAQVHHVRYYDAEESK